MRAALSPSSGELWTGTSLEWQIHAAFYELGLKWHWDELVYDNVLSEREERDRLLGYLKTHQLHLLSAYDPEFLITAIETSKARCYDALVQTGARRHINWADFQQHQVGA